MKPIYNTNKLSLRTLESRFTTLIPLLLTSTLILFTFFIQTSFHNQPSHNFSTRHYNMERSRFIGEDPAAIDPLHPITLNKFVYANNNPLRYVDPDGRFAFLAVGALAIGSILFNPTPVVAPEFDTDLGAIDSVSDMDLVKIYGKDIALTLAGGKIAGAALSKAGKLLQKTALIDELELAFKHNPLQGTKYLTKVKGQMKRADYHAFPNQVDSFAGLGKQRKIVSGDGISRLKIELEGFYRGKQGVFEWIIEPNNTINHRIFRTWNQ